MLISYQLLKQHIDFDIPVEELAERLTMQGLEVEEVISFAQKPAHTVVGLIEAMEKHPNADKLTLCSVNNGSEELKIICGASNMSVGDKVCVAQVGGELPGGFKIKKAKLRGVESYGMLCSKSELGLEEKSEGIWILPADAKIGEDIIHYLPEEDHILDIAFTANRGDCLSMIGVAREVAGMVGQTVKLPDISLKSNSGTPKPEIEIKDTEVCYRYGSRIMTGVKVGESPDWLKEALIKLGSRPINNVVDITNYVLLEMGHPLHAFDLKKLAGQKIIVRKAKSAEKIVGIDGVERALTDEMLVIADEKTPVAVAGVMGGLESSVTGDTVDLLLESAYFAPESIRGTSKKLDLSTESSYRFERGTDCNGIINSLDRCAKLIQEICGGEISELVDVYPVKVEEKTVEVRVSFVNERLGVSLTENEIRKFLEPLGFTVNEVRDGVLSLSVPGIKTDVCREIDVVEEIARLYGYNNIPETIPSLNLNPDNTDTHSSLEDRIRNILIGFGLNEVINYSFTSEKELQQLGYPHDTLIKTKNPLTADNESLRNGLLHSALNIILHNVHHGNKRVNIFEIGSVFYQDGNDFVEKKKLSVALYGLMTERGIYGAERVYDFYDLKGMIEGLFQMLGESSPSFQPHNAGFLHPSKSASITYGDDTVGYLGECHPRVQQSYKLTHPIYFCEIDLHKLRMASPGEKYHKEISKFPDVLRDLAILVDETLASQDVVDEIKASSKFLSRAQLVDVYHGKNIPNNKKSLAFSLSFTHPEKTLSDSLVDKELNTIVKRLQEKCGGEMRTI